MTEFQAHFSPLLRVFVYGTLKPGEMYYQQYFAGKVVSATRAIAIGELFDLPMGYPAMTSGSNLVYGYLLCLVDTDILTELDELEDYIPTRPESDNLYNRQIIEIYDAKQEHKSLGLAWVYLMTKHLVHQLGGVIQPDGWWTQQTNL